MTATSTGTALKSRQRAREQRLDDATVDVEDAWEAFTEAQAAVEAAELTVAAGVERLVSEKLTVAEVADLTGLDQATVRRLRQVKPSPPAAGTDGPGSPT